MGAWARLRARVRAECASRHHDRGDDKDNALLFGLLCSLSGRLSHPYASGAWPREPHSTALLLRGYLGLGAPCVSLQPGAPRLPD